jgi:HD-GYP domain-containing protein (c-di-GMP phosphodiesterase class II)
MADSTSSQQPDLIAVSPAQLHVGAQLRFTLRDEAGRVLLAKGLRIEDLAALESLQKRKAVFVEYEESDEALKVLMSGLNEATRRDAPLKDIDKLVSFKNPEAESTFKGTLPEAWAQIESRLKINLGQLAVGGETGADALQRLATQVDQIRQELFNRDRDAAVFVLLHRAVTGFSGYSALHALLCSCVCHLLAEPLKLTPEEDASLVRAALTMNVTMTTLQDLLAGQKSRPSPQQQAQIDAHPTEAVRLLRAVGVTDPLWLKVILSHHADLPCNLPLAQRSPAERLTRILQVVDRYTAAMSPRISRAGRDAKDAARSAIVQAGAGGHDEVGLALVQVLGLHPAGTFVKLANGETAVVLRRGAKASEPYVASVLNKRDEPIAEPRLHHTASAAVAVAQAVSASTIRVRLNLDAMLKILAFSKTGPERGLGLR